MSSTFREVSVVVPTYNRAELIGETLQSVLAQTYRNFEVIIVDDGSTDSTGRVVSQIMDSRVTYYYQDHSGLPAKARNVGIRLARGRYIAFLDSDDIWLPEKLALQIPYMDEHPGCAFTFTNGEFFDTDGHVRRINKLSFVRRRSIKDLLCGNFIPTLTVIVRRDCLEAVGEFNEDSRMKAIEDYELWLRLASRYPFAFLSRITARCRRDERSLAGTDPVRAAQLAISMLETMRSYLALPDRDFRRGLAAHYRRLARAQLLAGNREGYCEALVSAWRTNRDWRTGTLLALHRLTGFHSSKWITAFVRKCKYLLDSAIWRINGGARQVLVCLHSIRLGEKP